MNSIRHEVWADRTLQPHSSGAQPTHEIRLGRQLPQLLSFVVG